VLGKGMGSFGGAAIWTVILSATPAVALAQDGAGQQGGPGVNLALVVVAVLAGIVVGLIPALLLGAALGIVPGPAWARAGGPSPARADMAARAPSLPLGFAAGAAEEPAVPAPPPPAGQTPPRPEPAAAPPAARPAAARPPEPADAQPEARERHRELYEAEYSWQEHHLDALRQSIRWRLENPPDGGGTR
jgi:hypothetical protein